MKNKNLLILSVIFTIILAGCQTDNTKTTETAAPNTTSNMNITIDDEQTASDTNADIEINEEQTGKITTQTLSDSTAYDSAVDLKDESFCEKISDNTYKAECKIEVKDKTIYDAALSNNDTNSCKELSTADKQNACKIAIEANQRSKEIFMEEQKEREVVMNLYNGIVQEKDVSRCQELQESMIASCEFNILVDAANQEQNPQLCEKASSSETITRCKNSYRAEDTEPLE